MSHPISAVGPRTAAAGAVVGGAALALGGLVGVTDTPSAEAAVAGIEHVQLAALSAGLAALVALVLYLGRLVERCAFATIAALGQLTLAVLCTISNVHGENPSFFGPVAIAGNVLILVGWIALAVALRRAALVPTNVAIALPAMQLLLFPGSRFGGAVIAGACFAAAGWMLHHGEWPPRTAPPALEPAPS